MLPIPMILSACGAAFLFGALKKRWKILAILIYLAIILTSLYKYWSVYSGTYLRNYSWAWQYGYKEVVDFAKENYDDYDKIIVTKKYGEPHEFFLYYLKYDPDSFVNNPDLIRFFQSDWFWVDRFDKFYFVNDWQVKDLVLESGGEIDCKNSNCLLITSPGNSPVGFDKVEEVDFSDGKKAFEIYSKEIEQ